MSVWFLLLVFITVGCFGARLSISHKFGVRLCVLAGFWKAGTNMGEPLLLSVSF